MQMLIKQIRAYLNMSQTEFAEQLNVTLQTVNRWENGRAMPNKLAQSKMFDLCREKHVPVYDMTLKKIAGESKAIKPYSNQVLFITAQSPVLRVLLSQRAESNVILAKASIWEPIPVRHLP